MKQKFPKAMMCLLFLAILLSGCTNETDPKIVEFLGGDRVLRKMTSYTGEKIEGSGSFFLFSGSANITGESQISVMFAWRMNDGSYQISSLPLTKIRVKFNDQAESPTIKFVLQKPGPLPDNIDMPKNMETNVQDYLDKRVDYAILTVKESDWKPDVQLPFNQAPEKN
jgi:hypothetical protein